MLKGYRILTSFCVICATLYGGAYGAASVRSGTTGRAGSLRTLGAGTTASVKAIPTSAQPGPSVSGEESDGANTARMAHLTGLGDSKISGKLSLPSAASSQTINELRQAIEQLRSDYEALGNQYDNLSGDVSDVYNTAQVARAAATNNTNTLTVVRSDLNDAKSDIEDLKENGLFNAERVAGAVENVLADKNYATQSQLAVTDAVARGAVQPNQLPQKLDELGVADKDYVDSAVANGMNEDQVSTIVGGAIANTMSNYLTEAQTRSAIRNATENKVDKSYVDTQLVNSVYNRATYDYVDNKVATGMNEGKISNIVGEVLGDSLANYYTKGETTNVIQDAIENKVDKGQFNNAVSDIQGAMGNMATRAYVDDAVANLDLDLDENVVKGIVEQYNYMNQTGVNDVVNNRLNNYYTKSETNTAINNARQGLVDQNYFNNTISNMNNSINNLAPKTWVTDQINTTIETMDKGLSAEEVETMISAKGYQNAAGVDSIINGKGYQTADEVAAAILRLAPGADIEYTGTVLKFKDKNGITQTIDMRGLNGQDGAQVELRKDSSNNIEWRWTSGDDTTWHPLINVSELKGEDGKSIELGVQSINNYGIYIKDALMYRKEGDTSWNFLYNMDNIKGADGSDGCGVSVDTRDYVNGTETGKMVTLYKDCPGQTGHGQQLANFTIKDGKDGAAGEGGTITDDQINNLLAEYLKESVADSKYAVKSTEDKFGNMDSKSTVTEFVGSKLGALGNQTVKQYVDNAFEGINTGVQVAQDSNGKTYICKTGNNCTTTPPSSEWAEITVDMANYYNKTQSDERYALKTTVAEHTTDIATLQSNKADKTELNDYLTTQNAANTYATKPELTSVSNKATAAQADATTALNKFGDLGTQTTVRSYVDNAVSGLATEAYVDNKVATVRPTIQVGTYNGTTYICKTGDCNDEPDPNNVEDWAKWAPLDVNLDVLDGFGGTGEPQKVKGYIDTELDKKLDKTGIKLMREGDSIKISGGGIASPYAVANVTDLMCKSYEVESKGRTGDKVTYELKCITSDDE